MVELLMNDKFGRRCNEAVTAFSVVLSWYLPGESEESHEKLNQDSTSQIQVRNIITFGNLLNAYVEHHMLLI
jgi:hypothetical protein